MKRPRLRSRLRIVHRLFPRRRVRTGSCDVKPTQVQAFSGQNLWALVNVGGWPNVRVSTLISEVSYPEGFVLLVPYVQSAPSCLLAPGLLPWLMSQEVAFDIGSVVLSWVRKPRLRYHGWGSTTFLHLSQLHRTARSHTVHEYH